MGIETINLKKLEEVTTTKQQIISFFPENKKEIDMFSDNAIFTFHHDFINKEFFVYEELSFAEDVLGYDNEDHFIFLIDGIKFRGIYLDQHIENFTF